MAEEKRINLSIGSSDFISLNRLKTDFCFQGVSDVLMENFYNAAGQKVQKRVYDMEAGTEGMITNVEYLDGFQYVGSVLNFFPTAEGYVSVTLNENSIGTPYIFNYVYNYTDHLGNIRLSYTKDPVSGDLEIMEENHYYPFGLKHSVYATGPKQKYQLVEEEENMARPGYVYKTDYNYKYNGKEFQDELGLNWYDYQWRNYDPALGRWFNIDPAAEISRRNSPYVYALNNPVYFIDPDGMIAEGFGLDTDFKLSQNGSIERVDPNDGTESDPTDTLYATDTDGNVDRSNSITVSKGVLDNTETVMIHDDVTDKDNDIPTRIMDATATENSQALFEFMSDNTYVEHSIASFENGKTFIGTSFEEHVELSLNHTIPNNGNLTSYDHSHPSGTGPSEADQNVAGLIQSNQPGTTLTFRIYSPITGQYSTYDQNSGGTELNEVIIRPNKK